MIVDGRAITKDILCSVREDVAALGRVPVVRVIVVAPETVTESYLGVKSRRAKEAGMTLDIVRLPETASEEDVITALRVPGADALLVQLPLPAGLDTKRILNAIPLEKDADVLSDRAHEAFEKGVEGALLPPVVGSVEEVLVRSEVDPKGKKAVVVGSGWLVGAPVATWLAQKGAIVEVVTEESGDEGFSELKHAEIVVSGAGAPGILKPQHFTKGVVLIDAGTSESGGAIVGDAVPECADIASVFTPVPGGVGPIAVACLFQNAALLAKRAGLQAP